MSTHPPAPARVATTDLAVTAPGPDGQNCAWQFLTIEMPTVEWAAAQYSAQVGQETHFAVTGLRFTPSGMALGNRPSMRGRTTLGSGLAAAHPEPFSLEVTQHAIAVAIDSNGLLLGQLAFSPGGAQRVTQQLYQLHLLAYAYTLPEHDQRAAALTLVQHGFTGSPDELDTLIDAVTAHPSIDADPGH